MLKKKKKDTVSVMSRDDVVLTRAFNEELLSVAAQQCPREEGGEVDEDLPQKRSCLL